MTQGSDSGNSRSFFRLDQTAPFWMRLLLVGCVAGSIIYLADSGAKTMHAKASKDAAEFETVRTMGLVDTTAKGLASRFTDAQHRLLADPPASPDKIVDPGTIVLAHLETSDNEEPLFPWQRFEAHLAAVTGREVVDQSFGDTPDELAQLESRGITMVALHAADAPFLVNNYGYQPVAVLGDENGGVNGNHLDILVPADSPISKPSDLRGQTLVCTVPASITGYRAAVTLLLTEQGLRPNVDYFITWSLKQRKAILGVAHREYEAAAVSDDKLQALLASGDVHPSEIRSIYQSAVIPRTTIGWFYNLNPRLAGKIREAILSFRPDASTSQPAAQDQDSDSSPSQFHFIPIDYKRDFELVRMIDDRFDPRMGAKKSSVARADNAPSTEP